MGIKFYFSWHRRTFDKHIKKLSLNQKMSIHGIKIDNLIIDLNGLFHSSTQKIYEYGEFKPTIRLMKKKHDTINSLKKQIMVFEDVCGNINKIFNIVNPSKRLILCVDGPAPAAKQTQQRPRRFLSASQRGDSGSDSRSDSFDSNNLTPGTRFMDNLTKYIDWYIHKNISEGNWKNLEVVYSNEKTEGEGEHKGFSYVRKYAIKTEKYCLHGMDADLIMLAFGTQLDNFWILRDDLYDSINKFFVLDIGSSRKDLVEIMRWKGNFNSEYAINDFILMCFMVGNDFLPHVPSLEILEGSIDDMLDIYRNVGETYGHLTTHQAGGDVVFVKKPMKIFLGTVGRYDKHRLEDKLKKKETFFPDLLLEKYSKLSRETTDKELKYDINMDNYKKEYYDTHFKCENSDDIKSICHQYLEGIQWVLSYYTKGVSDWKWCFKYNYAPFAKELTSYTSSFKYQKKDITYPYLPFQQLLSVLPPKSSNLLPFPLCKLLTEDTSSIKKYCPDKFDVDLSGKRKDWEGIVLIPLVNFDIVKKEYDKYIDKVDPKELHRNKLVKSRIYTYSPMQTFTYYSFYGNILNCPVRYQFIDM